MELSRVEVAWESGRLVLAQLTWGDWALSWMKSRTFQTRWCRGDLFLPLSRLYLMNVVVVGGGGVAAAVAVVVVDDAGLKDVVEYVAQLVAGSTPNRHFLP